MPTISTEKALKLMGGKLYCSLSRLKLAKIFDETFMHVLRLFDQASISRFHRWLLGYARVAMFQKMQTLFQMGKRDELLELLDYAEKVIPELRELANQPDVFVTVSGKQLDPEEVKKAWNRPVPKWVKKFMENTGVWDELIKEKEETG